IAAWGTSLLNTLPPMRVRGIPISFETHVDGTTVLFTTLLGVACGVVFGLAPSRQSARVDPQQTLRSGAGTPPRKRLRLLLMAVEVALASMVLTPRGLFLQSFLATRQEDPGFRRDGVLLAGYDLSGRSMPDGAIGSFAGTLLEQLREVPGLEGAAIASSVPLDIHGLPSRFFTLEGRARNDDGYDEALTNTVTAGSFAVDGC